MNNGDGTFTYTPASSEFLGTVTFRYHANDGSVDSEGDGATVTIDVAANASCTWRGFGGTPSY
mgnify:CR=1 FL=1